MGNGDNSLFTPPPSMGSIVFRCMGEEERGSEALGGNGDTQKKREAGAQNDSSCPTDRSPLGVEARDEPLSMLSEPEL